MSLGPHEYVEATALCCTLQVSDYATVAPAMSRGAGGEQAARARLTFTVSDLSQELEHSKGRRLSAFTVLLAQCLLKANALARQPFELCLDPQMTNPILQHTASMPYSWPPAPTVEDFADADSAAATESVTVISSLQDTVAPQPRTFPDTSGTPGASLSSTPETDMAGARPPAPIVEDLDCDDNDIPALEGVTAQQLPISHAATTMPGSWPSATELDDCHETPPATDGFDDMPGLEDVVAMQQPIPSSTPSTAAGGTSLGNAQNANVHPPFPFPMPFSASMSATVGPHETTDGQALPFLVLANMFAQAFGPLIGVPADTAPGQPSIPSTTAPFPDMADIVSSLHSQQSTGAGGGEWEDASEDGDSDTPALEAAVEPEPAMSTLHAQQSTKAAQDEYDGSEDEDSDMPSLEAAPQVETSVPPTSNLTFPTPVPYPNPFNTEIEYLAQSFATVSPNSQASLPGTAQDPAVSQGSNGASSDTAHSTDSGEPQGGSPNLDGMPPAWPFPGAITVSMGTLSPDGPTGPQFTAATTGLALDPQSVVSFNDFAAGIQQVLSSMTVGDPLPFFPGNFEGSLNDFATMFNMGHPALAPCPPFDATEFVDSLERVNIANIPEEDMRCPHCWLPFGATDEDDPDFVFTPDRDEVPMNAERQVAFHELPFCTTRPDNDPVRTPCGHIFGRGCLIETLERVNTRCPTCRQELRPSNGGSQDMGWL